MRVMRLASLSLLVAVSWCPVLAGAAPETACNGEAVLERAAHVYREARGHVEVVRYEVLVPGAPVHREEAEFGFGSGGEAFLRMPQGYLVTLRAGHLFGFAGSRTDAFVVGTLAGGTQAAVDRAFLGTGPPLVPVPILLSRASSGTDRAQAFASKFLAPLSLVGCSTSVGGDGHTVQQVDMRAANGTLRATFEDSSGLLRALTLEVVPAPGQAPIRAEARFENVAPGELPPLPQPGSGAAAFSSFAELEKPAASAAATLAGVEITMLDGTTSRLGAQGSVVVLEFWASWCAPCRLTLPMLGEFARWARQSGRPVEVRAVNTLEGFRDAADARDRLAPYLAANPIDVPVALDLDASLHRRLGSGLPLTAVVDASGRIAATYVGFEPGLQEKLRATVTALVGRPARQ